VNDEVYMKKALDLARQAEGWTSPNPMVGAVLVRDGRIVGQGFHQRAGGPHAEVHALAEAGEAARGSTLYVTLEPCSHHGRTPPCVEAILKAQVSRVVAAMTDPNPRVDGTGLARLKSEGVDVTSGVLEEEARTLNEVFVKYISAQLPFVAVKGAITLDGKIATRTGSSKWITGQAARGMSQQLRHRYDAILVGIGTVLADDPQLTCRISDRPVRQPTRIVIDSHLQVPLEAQVVRVADAPTIIYTANGSGEKADILRRQGVTVVPCPDGEGRVDLVGVLQDLAAREITGVLVEGGGEINGSLLDRCLVDKIYTFIAPKVVGSQLAPGMFGGRGIDEMTGAIPLDKVTWEQVGQDLLVTGYPQYKGGYLCSPDWWKN